MFLSQNLLPKNSEIINKKGWIESLALSHRKAQLQ
jgi:hypothetical protein